MEKRRGTLLVSMVILMSALLGGCGNKENAAETSTKAAEAKEHVYKAEVLNLGDLNTETVNNIYYYDDKMLVIGEYWENVDVENLPQPRTEEGTETVTEEEAEADDMAEGVSADEKIAVEAAVVDEIDYVSSKQIQFFAVYDYEGNQLSYAEYEVPENTWMGQGVAAKEEEAFYCVMESYYEDASDPDNYIWEETHTLVKKNLDGTEVWSLDLDEQLQGSGYVNTLLCDDEGQMFVFMENGETLVMDKEGQIIRKFQIEEEDMGSVLLSADGKMMVTFWKEDGQYVKVLDKTTGQLSGNYKVPGNSYNFSYLGGYGYDLFLTDTTALYGYNLGEEQLTELMNYVDSDLDMFNMYNIHGISDTQFYAAYYSYLEGKTSYALFTKVPPEEVVDKQILTLGCTYLDDDVRRQVVQFNKANEQYRIQIKDYSVYDTENDYTQSFSKLNTDIVSGNIPDILVLNDNLPVDSYIAKGLFEDLYPYIDADEEMDRSDFMTNIFDAYSVDGKLYQLAPTFSVVTVAGKTADVGEGPGWNLDELNALVASKPEGTEVFFDTVRSTVLYYCMQMSSEQFINWDTGECNFDSDGFVKLLEFINQFPEEYDDSKYDEEFWATSGSVYRDGRALLQIYYLSTFSEYNMTEKGTFGEDITFIGFPAENKNGSAIECNIRFAMSSKSENKEGAWEFLRYFLSYEYQKGSYGFPTNLKLYEELKQEAMQRPYYYDENDQKVEYDASYYLDGVDIPIPPMTEEEVQEVEDFLFSLNQVTVYDDDLMNIITEEAEAYFEGQKSAKEVAAIIQSRAQIYVNENR